MVVEDKVEKWEMDGKQGETRSLQLVDLDNDTPLVPKVRLKIPTNDKVAGPANQSNLRNAVVDCAVTDISQNDFNKRLTLSGHVIAIVGTMNFQAAPDAKPVQGGK